MVHEKEAEKNCFTPRDYQVELLDKACKKNVIVQLGTGAGKTFIAVLLLKEYGLQLNRKFSQGGKRAFFIVASVSLVNQQAEHIECHTTYNTERIHGNRNTDFWGCKSEYEKMLEDHPVIVITAQVFLDTLNHGFFDMKRAAVLIFDECHHAMGLRHAYRQVMEQYGKLPEDSQPRVLGLTASLINNKTPPRLLETNLTKLEQALHCCIETASDLVELSKYGANPDLRLIVCEDFRLLDEEAIKMGRYLGDCIKFIDKCESEFLSGLDCDTRKLPRDAFTKIHRVLQILGPWAAWKLTHIWEKKHIKEIRENSHLPSKSLDILLLGLTVVETVKRRLETIIRSANTSGKLFDFVPHKLIRLFELFSAYAPENQERLGVNDPLCAIVFVKERFEAYAINQLMKFVSKVDPRYRFLRSDYIVGVSSQNYSGEEAQNLHKRLDEVLRKFRKSELNVVIATSVLEEGVDVRHCNLVVKYDRPEDYRSYVQSKGRARKPGAKYAIFVEQRDQSTCSDDLRDFSEIEKILLKRSKTIHNPADFQLIEADIDAKFPPYVVKSTGARVSLTTAVQLINRYCARLPSDIFTRLVPHSRIIKVTEKNITRYKAELLLPINSPIKEAITLETPVDSKKLAQMCVALEACKILHKRGELNDHLLPVGRESIAKLLSQLDDDPDEFCPGMNAKVGSSRRKQLYDRRVANDLHNAVPINGNPLYLYVFEMELLKEPSIEHNPKGRKFVRPEDYEHCFGFLSSIMLPNIPPFTAYLRQGDMRVHIKKSPSMVTLNSQKLTYIKHFHHYIFDKVLQLYKGILEFKMGESTPVNTLIIPVNRVITDNKIDYSINMTYVEQVVLNTDVMPRRPDEEDRKNYKFHPEDYRDAVVMPWYRNTDQPQFFYVAEIIDDLSPNSRFPDNEYESFNDYFIKKYNLMIYDQEQSLLDVDFTSNRLNLLLPRPGGAKKKPRGDQAQQQIFVPELMDKHPINATLWNLISALPSCFYRMNHLLLADELRVKIVSAALLMDPALPDGFEWEPLSYPATYEEKQSLIVSKIQQLREMTKMKEESCGVPILADAHEFEIGVWDPVVDSLANENNDQKENLPPDDTIGLMSTGVTSGDLSDDDDDDNVIMHDYTAHLKEKVEPATIRSDIKVLGWGNVDAEIDNRSDFEILPLPGNSPIIDVKALKADFEKNFLNDVPVPLERVSRSKVLGRNVNGSTSTSGRKDGAIDPLAKFEEDEKILAKEEIIDLSEFEESENQTKPNQSDDISLNEVTSDDEFENLSRGETLKILEDAKFVDESKMIKGEILAPLIEESFSFASPSPLSATLVVKCPPTSSGNDLMYKNPYGVSPCGILTALTTSNATDGINLERLETIGDSFLKYAVTDFLYHMHSQEHEGKLSFARSKEVSNCNLYRLGKKLGIPSLIIGTKFDVQDTWLPPCSVPPDFKAPNSDDAEEKDRFMESVLEENIAADQAVKPATGWDAADGNNESRKVADGVETIEFSRPTAHSTFAEEVPPLPHNHLTQQYISDKSIADAMEALIGAHLLALGPTPTLKVMRWMGLKVLTSDDVQMDDPLLRFVDTPENPELSRQQLVAMYEQFSFQNVEDTIGYRFNKKAYLIQAFTHASYYKNRITGCYQRLEFLGDAVLDYMITRFLYEDGRQYSPGVLTDLRSALVNNTIFASLAVKYRFHKHFIVMCPGLHHMIEKFVRLCQERKFFDANFNAEMYMVTTEEEIDEGQEEDIEVPKALSDVFESVAGAVYLDSGRDLDVVWRVFHNLMKQTIDECCANPPRSPIRELMELEPGKTRFSKMERIIETGKVRVTVDVGGKMRFTGMGRNYRIAKTTAAKRALRYIKSLAEQRLREAEKKSAVKV